MRPPSMRGGATCRVSYTHSSFVMTSKTPHQTTPTRVAIEGHTPTM